MAAKRSISQLFLLLTLNSDLIFEDVKTRSNLWSRRKIAERCQSIINNVKTYFIVVVQRTIHRFIGRICNLGVKMLKLSQTWRHGKYILYYNIIVFHYSTTISPNLTYNSRLIRRTNFGLITAAAKPHVAKTATKPELIHNLNLFELSVKYSSRQQPLSRNLQKQLSRFSTPNLETWEN